MGLSNPVWSDNELPAQPLEESSKSGKEPRKSISGFYTGGGLLVGNVTATEDDWWDSDSETGDSDLGFVLNGGYRFNRYFALELGYLDGGKPEFDDQYFQRRVDVELDLTAVEFSAVALLPFRDRFEVYAKAGLSFWDADADQIQQISGFPPTRFQTSDDGTDLLIAFGAGITFLEDWYARVEYQAFSIDDDLLLLDSDYSASYGALAVEVHYRFGDGW